MTDIHVPMCTTANHPFPSSLHFARPVSLICLCYTLAVVSDRCGCNVFQDALKGSLPQTLRAVRPTAFLGMAQALSRISCR